MVVVIAAIFGPFRLRGVIVGRFFIRQDIGLQFVRWRSKIRVIILKVIQIADIRVRVIICHH